MDPDSAAEVAYDRNSYRNPGMAELMSDARCSEKLSESCQFPGLIEMIASDDSKTDQLTLR